jgi:hypothetical protein
VNTTIGGDVARYAGAVRAAFADLDAPTREMLLEDLEDHLQEVAAEAGGPLEERLGAPETYAASCVPRPACLPPVPPAAAGPGAACASRGSPAAWPVSGLGWWPTRPARPSSGSCPSCGRPGGCCAATCPCRRPAWLCPP